MFVVTIQPTLSITQSYPQILFPLRVRLLVKFSGKKGAHVAAINQRSLLTGATILSPAPQFVTWIGFKFWFENDGIGTTAGLWYGAKKLQDPRPKLIEAFEFWGRDGAIYNDNSSRCHGSTNLLNFPIHLSPKSPRSQWSRISALSCCWRMCFLQ